MAIKAECPLCHRKQAVKNKVCACGQRMDNAKRSKKVKYHIVYRLPNGKQKQEFAGYSITEAKTAEGKRLTQRYENHRILQKVPEEKMTFRELTEWYLELPKVKDLKAYRETKIRLNNFNAVLGEQIVGSVKLTDLENYQYVRKASGIAATTNDQEQRDIKTAINKAFKNDLVSGHTKKTFDNWERLTKKEERSRNRPVALEEYAALLNGCAAEHLRSALILGMHTGMRPGEIKGLRWSHVDLKSGFIRLPADIVKEKRDKAIPPLY